MVLGRTSSQVIKRASPLRVAVKIKNSKHRMVDEFALLARTVSMAVHVKIARLLPEVESLFIMSTNPGECCQAKLFGADRRPLELLFSKCPGVSEACCLADPSWPIEALKCWQQARSSVFLHLALPPELA